MLNHYLVVCAVFRSCLVSRKRRTVETRKDRITTSLRSMKNTLDQKKKTPGLDSSQFLSESKLCCIHYACGCENRQSKMSSGVLLFMFYCSWCKDFQQDDRSGKLSI